MASLDRFRVGLRQSWFHRVGGIATLLIFGCVLGCAKADTYVKGQDGTLYILVTDAARAQFIVSRGVYVTRVDAPDARYQDVNQEYQPCRYHLVDRPRTVAAREGTYIAVFPQLHQGFVDGQWRVYSGNPPRNNQEKGAPVGQGAPPLIQTAPASSAPRSERF